MNVVLCFTDNRFDDDTTRNQACEMIAELINQGAYDLGDLKFIEPVSVSTYDEGGVSSRPLGSDVSVPTGEVKFE